MRRAFILLTGVVLLSWCREAAGSSDPLVDEARMLMAGTFPLEFLPRSSSAGNSIVIESKDLAPGESTSIGVYITNDEPIRCINIPLIIRSIWGSGAYITSLSASYHEESRLNSFLTGMYNGEQIWPAIINTYPHYEPKAPSQCPGPDGHFPNPIAPPDYVSPDGILFSRGRILPSDDLPPGTDGVPGEGIPMITIDVTANEEAGVFVIDTTCIAPCHHVFFSRGNNTAIVPEFTAGFISIGRIGEPVDTGNVVDTLPPDPPVDTVVVGDTLPPDPPFDTVVVVDTLPPDPPVDTVVVVDTLPPEPPVDTVVIDVPPDTGGVADTLIGDIPADTGRVSPPDDEYPPEPASGNRALADVLNYPNPFNAATTIHYEVAKDSRVALEVFDLLGRRVRKLVDRFQSPGEYDVPWDGRTDAGETVSAGIYFYRCQAGPESVVGKMVFVK